MRKRFRQPFFKISIDCKIHSKYLNHHSRFSLYKKAQRLKPFTRAARECHFQPPTQTPRSESFLQTLLFIS